jgi:soluble lytic murein transglycosylase-like protein
MTPTYVMAVRAYAAAKELLALIGLAALLGFFILPLPASDFGVKHLPTLGAEVFPIISTAAAAGGTAPSAADAAREREQRALTEFIAKRYRVSDEAIANFVSIAYRAGEQHAVDPLLILAVMAIESRYNPVAESTMGAKGLMQVIPKFHLEKLMDHGGEPALLEPEVNITVGAQILREYQRRFRDLEAALQMYGGAFDEPTAQYATKVLTEKARLDLLRQRARRQSAQSA